MINNLFKFILHLTELKMGNSPPPPPQFVRQTPELLLIKLYLLMNLLKNERSARFMFYKPVGYSDLCSAQLKQRNRKQSDINVLKFLHGYTDEFGH